MNNYDGAIVSKIRATLRNNGVNTDKVASDILVAKAYAESFEDTPDPSAEQVDEATTRVLEGRDAGFASRKILRNLVFEIAGQISDADGIIDDIFSKGISKREDMEVYIRSRTSLSLRGK